MSMEKITEWQWKPTPESRRQTDAYFFNADDGSVWLSRAEQSPVFWMRGDAMLALLQMQPYEALFPINKITFNFLRSRIGE